MVTIAQCAVLFLAISLSEAGKYVEEDIDLLTKSTKFVFRQLQMQQTYLEDRLRTDAASGIRRLRMSGQGNKPLYLPSHSDTSFMGMHNHPDKKDMVGLSAFEAVLNGIEFTTRDNDYPLRRPSTTSSTFLATEEVEHPEVPPEVLAKTTVEEQIAEMREWFKAFNDQDHGVRDYRKYFKPLMCYLEGYWHEIDKVDQDEFVKRSSRFMAHSGSVTDDYSYLPTKLMNIVNDTNFLFGQWNYRVMCHPLSKHLSTKVLRLGDDLPTRLINNLTLEEYAMTPLARFSVCPYRYAECKDMHHEYVLLDDLVGEIPGMNNYGAVIRDNLWADGFLNFNRTAVLNAGYYHRWFSSYGAGAMGSTKRHRTYSDETIFFAMTDHDQVAGMVMWNGCENNPFVCSEEYAQKWTYMVPLEIIYLTPLHNWNPYGITDYGDANTIAGQEATENGIRNGGNTPETAFKGTNSDLFYRTPASFFSGGEHQSQSGDSGMGSVGVLDGNGNVQQVYASGTRTFFPEIPDVGVVRQRYPIAPVFGEYGAIWKELSAIEDMLNRKFDYYKNLVRQKKNKITLMMVLGVESEGALAHTHYIELDEELTEKLYADKRMVITTGPATAGDEHTHEIEVSFTDINYNVNAQYVTCDGEPKCHHNYPLALFFNREQSH